jgi:hypothetical protein
MKMWGSNNPADDHLCISPTGNVGIGGATALDNKLEVLGNLRLRNAPSTNPSIKMNNGDVEVVALELDTGATGVLGLRDHSLNIDVNGNVGIGTTAAGHPLVVVGSADKGISLINSSNVELIHMRQEAGDSGAIFLKDGGGVKVLLTSRPSNPSYFNVNGSNFGIGTSDPKGKLAVITTSDTSGTPTAYDDKYFTVGTAGATAGNVFISYDQTNNRGYIGALSPSVAWRPLILQPGGGNVGIGTATPAATLDVNGDVRIGNSTRGHYLGEKAVTLNGTTYTTALTIVLSDHNAAHVKLFLTGDWNGHSAVAYVGEYFIQNGGGGYAEPGMIISEFDNTATDFIESKIVDPSTDTFTIQLKLSDSDNGTMTGQICYHAMGEVTSVT